MTTTVRSLPILTAIGATIMLSTMAVFNTAYLGITLGETVRMIFQDGIGAIPWMAVDLSVGLLLAWFCARTGSGVLLTALAALGLWLVLSAARGEMAQAWAAPASILWHSDASSLLGSVASGASVWIGRVLICA